MSCAGLLALSADHTPGSSSCPPSDSLLYSAELLLDMDDDWLRRLSAWSRRARRQQFHAAVLSALFLSMSGLGSSVSRRKRRRTQARC